MGFRNSKEAKREQNGVTYFIRKNNFSDYCQTCLYRSVKTCDKLAGN